MKYLRPSKEDNWEVFQRVANGGGYYRPRDQRSIFDIMYDVINKNLSGLEFKSNDLEGIKELYFRNG